MSSTASDQPQAETIVLIHGMWMTPLSWEHWVNHYTDRGHRVLAPAWPGLDKEPAELRSDPSPLRGIDITEVVDHYDKIIRGLDRPPIIIGHSFGGLFAQLLLDRGLGAAGVALSTAAPKGVLKLPLSTLRAAWPALGNPANLKKETPLTQKQFHWCFTNALSRDEASAGHRHGGSDLSALGQHVELQATEEGALCHRAQGIPRPVALAGPGRLGGSCGLPAQLDGRARASRRSTAHRG